MTRRALSFHAVLPLLAAVAAACATPALAAPGVALAPADGARFLVHQRFDIRAEAQGPAPYAAKLWLDGYPMSFTSGAQDSAATDGITSDGYGGFDLRGYSSPAPGWHTLTAQVKDGSGAWTKSIARFEVIDPFREDGGQHRDGGGAGRTKNIVILLGDGMGVAHRTAGRIVKYGVTAGQPNGWLHMDGFPGTGLVSTHSLNSIITDSAPGMACYATGNHAQNGQEGVYPAHVTNAFFAPRVEYMSEYLHRVQGTSLGLVTTADVEDATPAANAVHTANRNAGTGIVDQYLDEADAASTGAYGTGLAVLMGGGRRWFLPSTAFGSSRSAATDYPALPADLVAGWGLPGSAAGGADPGRDLLADFQRAGFTYASSKTDLDAALAGKVPSRLLGLFGYGNMNVAFDKVNHRRGVLPAGSSTSVVDDYHAPDQPMLDEMAEAAFRVLSRNRNGFVLMIEGAHIDKQSHLMDADRVIDEVIEFDEAVGVAKRWADELGDTTVIVLADHECSGFSLIGALTGGVKALEALPSEPTATDPSVIPARQKAVGTYDAAGFPRYELLADGYPRTLDVDGKVLVGFGANSDRYEGWLSKPLPVVDSLLPASLKTELASRGYAPVPAKRAESQFGFFVRGQLDGDGQAVHTATDIPVSAYSTGSEAWRRFTGVQTNTDVFFKLMRAALAGDDERR